jgi:hypothetical protein
MQLNEFLYQNKIQIKVNGRFDIAGGLKPNQYFYASFIKNVDDDSCIKLTEAWIRVNTGVLGSLDVNGSTPNEAISNLIKESRGKELVFEKWSNEEYTPVKIYVPSDLTV